MAAMLKIDFGRGKCRSRYRRLFGGDSSHLKKMIEAWTRRVEAVRMVDFWICRADCNVSGVSIWKDGMPITCDEKATSRAGIEEFSIGHIEFETSIRHVDIVVEISNNQSSNNNKSHKCIHSWPRGECHIKGKIGMINNFDGVRFKIKHQIWQTPVCSSPKSIFLFYLFTELQFFFFGLIGV